MKEVKVKSRLKVRLAELELSQAELADELGVSRNTFNLWANGKNFPSLEMALKLAKRLSCKVDDLFTYID